jgi:hypothetical protein
MRANFARTDVVHLERLRQQRAQMSTICGLFRDVYTRDQLVEAIDALRRSYGDATLATQKVNDILARQSVGHPLINGKPQVAVAKNWPATGTHRPMF